MKTVFVIPILILLFLSMICVSYMPVFSNFEPAKNDGKRVQLGMIKIIEKKIDHYVVYVNNDKPVKVKVVCAANLSVGMIVTFEGIYRNGTLYADRYYIHTTYEYPFLVSFFGLGILLILIRKEWRFEFSKIRFLKRKEIKRKGD
ncbi:MAG: hypothetical protein QXT63_01195 [Thermoplasmata archaeon]